MSFLLTLLAAKGLGALLGGLILASSGGPGFSTPVLVVRSDTVYLQTTLVRGFNKQLDQILESGSLVAVSYTVTLFSRAPGNQMLTSEPMSFFHSAVYDPVSHTFTVYRSEFSGRAESLQTGVTTRLAKETLSRVSFPLGPTRTFPGGHELSARVEAALNTISLEAMNNRELDLNVFWNYRYPRASTAWLRVRSP